MLTHRSDAELMELARDRDDPDAFRELAIRWRPRLSAFFRPLLGGRGVDDAVQDVLILLWTHRADYRASGRFEAYALTFARHHWLNLNRRRRLREAEAVESEGTAPAAEVTALEDDRLVRLAQAEAALPAGQRAVLSLVVTAGLTQREAAAQLGLPLGTVKSRLHHARRALAAALLEDDHA